MRYLLLLSLLLSACASAPRLSADLPGRDGVRDFALEARFALKVERPGEQVQQASGRLSWNHQNDSDTVFIANPLGTGLAEIDIRPQWSRLRLSKGDVREHADPDVLIRQATGYELPVSRLSLWLLGRGGEQAQLERDGQGRPARLRDAGWRVVYEYADESATALPYRLQIQHAEELNLTLRIEEWRDLP